MVALALPMAGACAEERLALLIGNQAYASKVGALRNPKNDVSLIGVALRKLGFKVTTVENAGLAYGVIVEA